ncbi:MAG: hypothetical protein R3D80_01235 [Paracoccaceae bacterium]
MRGLAAALAFCAALEPVSALALSCAPWSPEQAFDMAAASPSRYSVVVGSFAFDAGKLPQGAMPGAKGTVVPARLAGRALSQNGFDAAYAQQVRLDVSCAASWCGSLIPGQSYLVFVEHRSAGLTVDVGPCATVVFPNPSAAEERALTRCLAAGRCGTN